MSRAAQRGLEDAQYRSFEPPRCRTGVLLRIYQTVSLGRWVNSLGEARSRSATVAPRPVINFSAAQRNTALSVSPTPTAQAMEVLRDAAERQAIPRTAHGTCAALHLLRSARRRCGQGAVRPARS